MDVTRLITTFRTGVSAVRVTLWEGTKTMNDSSNVLLLDNISNYDMLEIESCIAWNADGTSKNGYISSLFEVNTILENPTSYISVSNFLNSSYNYSMDVIFPNNTYFKINGSSKGPSIITADITKITGIKYIKPDSYSTDEKLIGSWVDGKHLYKKTYNTNVIIDGNPHYIDGLIPENIDTVVEISGCVNTDTTINNWEPINTYYDDNHCCFCDLDEGKLRFKGRGWPGTWPANITIKYTKK